MRDPTEWTENDLLALIREQVTESLTLDYKACDSLQKSDSRKAELSKDVSAFANSAGGSLIYGIKESGGIPTDLDSGFDPSEISKEWIEQVINSRISRRIDGIVIRPIPLTGIRAGRVAYLVSVPASGQAPHMASDHRFYKRFNFESCPMEEYEVRDVSRRLITPDITLALRKLQDTPPLVMMDAYIENHSPAPAAFALVSLHLTANNYPVAGGVDKVAEPLIHSNSGSFQVHSFKLEWRGSLRLPIMRGARYQIAKLTMSVADECGPARIFWEILVPDSKPAKGTYFIEQGSDETCITACPGEWELAEPIYWKI